MGAPFYTDKIQYYKINEQGSDFVIGDIHGRYDLVEKALKAVNFKEKYDRLFCVGDLIDRGVESYKVLEFLERPYVHAIRGNHEDVLLDLYNVEEKLPDDMLRFYGQNMGMEWWFSVSERNRDLIIAALKKLPLVIEVESKRGNIGLVHADVPEELNWPEFKLAIENNENHVIQEALWGRTRLTYGIEKWIEGIGRVYVGHTPQSKITQLANLIAIDTGAVYNQHLTMVNMPCTTQIIKNAERPYDDIHILNPAEISSLPFSYTRE